MNPLKHVALQHLLDTAETLANIDQEPVEKTIEILRKAKKDGNQVFLFGNGGSHSNASHFANDLLKACGIKAICISDMIPTILAYMNDDGHDVMFANVLGHFFEENCVGIGFSCSGQSTNIIEPLLNLKGMPPAKNILFTGMRYSDWVFDAVIKVPHPNIRIQESCHSAICHAIVEALIAS